MKKKLGVLMLIVVLSLSLAACGGDGDNETTGDNGVEVWETYETDKLSFKYPEGWNELAEVDPVDDSPIDLGFDLPDILVASLGDAETEEESSETFMGWKDDQEEEVGKEDLEDYMDNYLSFFYLGYDYETEEYEVDGQPGYIAKELPADEGKAVDFIFTFKGEEIYVFQYAVYGDQDYNPNLRKEIMNSFQWK
jgi:hypothetical protein